MDWWTSQSLRLGTALAAVLVGSGFLLFLWRPDPVLGAIKPADVIGAGLVVLIGTSVFRVAVAVVAFAVESDYAHAAISALVFLVLIASLWLGKAG